jgi:solute carrier family 12 sodium/potassium/chloride transporter 2
MRSNLQQKAYRYLRFTNIKGFCSVADNSNLHTGVAAMLGLTGVGKVKPNILMMGYKNDWLTCDRNALDQYVLTIQLVSRAQFIFSINVDNDYKFNSTGFEMHVSVAILRLKEGLDCSGIVADIDDLILKAPTKKAKENSAIPGKSK